MLLKGEQFPFFLRLKFQKMNYREIYTKYVDKHAMLYQIAPYDKEGLPPNSIFYKGRCGIGGTTLEIKFDRHSLIVVPNTPAITSKSNDPELIQYHILGVMGEKGQTREAKIQKIMNELNVTGRYIKIMTTPDSFDCVIEAAIRLNKLEWLQQNFFLLLDECHSFVTEAFRENITIPFRYLWNFDKKCLISATPFEFSDPLFYNLDKHEIIINEKLGEIELIETEDIEGVVHFLLSRPDKFPGNVHIFYNSITKLSDTLKLAISKCGNIDVNLYCSPNDENIKKLEGIPGVFKQEPVNSNFKKFSIYTTRYFEAWDLKDKNATLILITDVNAKNTKVGISNKGFQALGRLRGKAHRLIHITNHANIDFKRELKYFKEKHTLYAKDTIAAYNIHGYKCKKFKVKPYKKLKEAVENYAELSADKYVAKLEIIKIDQFANHESCNEEYNNITFIQEAWERSNYDVVRKRVITSTIPNLQKVLVSDQLTLAFKMVKELEENKHNLLFTDDYDKGKQQIMQVNHTFEFAFKAYHILGETKIIEIGMNRKSLAEEIQKTIIAEVLVQIEIEVKHRFKLHHPYANKTVKEILQQIYNKTGYTKNGKTIKIANAKEIMHYVKHCDSNKYGYTITEFK
jgi:hypothetical protein